MGPEARVLSIGSRRCRSQCRPGTGAAFQKSQAPTGANVESMCRDRTSILQVFFRCRVCIRCACARPHGRTPGFQGPSGPTGEQKAPQIGALGNEPCWTRTNDHRIKSANEAGFSAICQNGPARRGCTWGYPGNRRYGPYLGVLTPRVHFVYMAALPATPCGVFDALGAF